MKIKLLNNDLKLLPTKARKDDAGWDLRASIDAEIMPHCVKTIPTGVAVEIPQGCVGFVCARSGMAKNDWIGVENGPGVVDPGYTGEACVILRNDSNIVYIVNKYAKIGQLVVVERATQGATLEIVEMLSESERGDKGFGSSGK